MPVEGVQPILVDCGHGNGRGSVLRLAPSVPCRPTHDRRLHRLEIGLLWQSTGRQVAISLSAARVSEGLFGPRRSNKRMKKGGCFVGVSMASNLHRPGREAEPARFTRRQHMSVQRYAHDETRGSVRIVEKSWPDQGKRISLALMVFELGACVVLLLAFPNRAYGQSDEYE